MSRLSFSLYPLQWLLSFVVAIIMLAVVLVEPSFAGTQGYYWRP